MRLPACVKFMAPPASLRRAQLVGAAVCLVLLGCPSAPTPSAPAAGPAPAAASTPAPVPAPAPLPPAAPPAAPTPPAPGSAGGGMKAPGKPLRSCDDVRAAYQALLTAAPHTSCSAAADCQTVSGECGLGLGGCYHAVNRAVTQQAVSALGTRYQELGCTGPVCRCTRPPVAQCVQGRCALP